MKKRSMIILLGPPGSGKTTLTDKFNEEHAAVIETGDLLRQEIQKETKLAAKLKAYLDSGKLAPADIVTDVIKEKISQIPEKIELVILDGFPRSYDEIDPLFEICRSQSLEFSAMIILELSKDTALQRLTGRRICSNCNKIYNIHFDPPSREDICDICGGQLKQREDDKPQVVKQRLDQYDGSTKPVIPFFLSNYMQKTILVSAEDPANQTWKKVAGSLEQINSAFKKTDYFKK